MEQSHGDDPRCDEGDGSVALVVVPRERDLGGFSVRRVLPAPRQRMVGPFIFLDHMGPAEFAPGDGIQVRPHPHIGLATITFLFEGEMMHRDSLGYVQPIREGAVNLMTAGRGIVHSERAGDDLDNSSTLHGMQSWMALPTSEEEAEPAFAHYPADTLPLVEQDSARVRVIIGSANGRTSPVAVASPTLYLEAQLEPDGRFDLPDDCPERAAYIVSGTVDVEDTRYDGGTMLVFARGRPVSLRGRTDSRVMVLGGDPFGERHIWWNFVSSSEARIEQAKADWRAQRFGRVPGDDEFIPLPE